MEGTDLLHALLHLLGGLLFLATLCAALHTEGRPVYLGAASDNGPEQPAPGSRSTPLHRRGVAPDVSHTRDLARDCPRLS